MKLDMQRASSKSVNTVISRVEKRKAASLEKANAITFFQRKLKLERKASVMNVPREEFIPVLVIALVKFKKEYTNDNDNLQKAFCS